MESTLKSSSASGAELITPRIWPYQPEIVLRCEGNDRGWLICGASASSDCWVSWKDLWKHSAPLLLLPSTWALCRYAELISLSTWSIFSKHFLCLLRESSLTRLKPYNIKGVHWNPVWSIKTAIKHQTLVEVKEAVGSRLQASCGWQVSNHQWGYKQANCTSFISKDDDRLTSRQLISKLISRTYLRCGTGSVFLLMCSDISSSVDMSQFSILNII